MFLHESPGERVQDFLGKSHPPCNNRHPRIMVSWRVLHRQYEETIILAVITHLMYSLPHGSLSRGSYFLS